MATARYVRPKVEQLATSRVALHNLVQREQIVELAAAGRATSTSAFESMDQGT